MGNNTFILDGHTFHKEDPSLKNLEKAINIASLQGTGSPDKENLISALSILLIGDESYKEQLKEAKGSDIVTAFSNEIIEQIKKLSISVGYINAINSLVVKGK